MNLKGLRPFTRRNISAKGLFPFHPVRGARAKSMNAR
jgi:hypothetical protein